MLTALCNIGLHWVSLGRLDAVGLHYV